VADLRELVPQLTGVFAVTIPTDEARQSVARALHAAAAAGIRLLGVIENMVGYRCSDCGHTGPLFPGSAGVGLAAEFEIPLLARIPFLAPPGATALDEAESARVFEVIG